MDLVTKADNGFEWKTYYPTGQPSQSNPRTSQPCFNHSMFPLNIWTLSFSLKAFSQPVFSKNTWAKLEHCFDISMKKLSEKFSCFKRKVENLIVFLLSCWVEKMLYANKKNVSLKKKKKLKQTLIIHILRLHKKDGGRLKRRKRQCWALSKPLFYEL